VGGTLRSDRCGWEGLGMFCQGVELNYLAGVYFGRGLNKCLATPLYAGGVRLYFDSISWVR
jgi:hypothetical protein